MIDLLVDTNILIYAMEKSSVFNPSAKSILNNPLYNIFITSKNISEFFAVFTKFNQKDFKNIREIQILDT